ncbi:YeiH family protein [Labilibacter marinus]|uniref:YeiH family protein n=1 Tax=Labilibacter marinus TaxID=1477105 RepID=UPI0009501D80|nr:putative sulfate exporter family transporter [Labilibacter marinus]
MKAKLNISQKQVQLIYCTIAALCFTPILSPAIALLLGIGLSLLGIKYTPKTFNTSIILQASIVLMGFGMNLGKVIETSQSAFFETAISVVAVMSIGILLGKLLKVDSKVSILIAAGTAICGGSAIAAVSNVLNPKNHQVSFSLIVIFILNALALFIFPYVGHHLNLSQATFGHWAAIAIHDTSSVVGAGAIYGQEALDIATTVKLVRALWIIPLSIVISFSQKKEEKGKVKVPYFIFLFVGAILVAHLLPDWQGTYTHFNWLGKKGMVLALFFIGTNISVADTKKAGIKSFVLGVSLWLVIAVGSLLVLNI